MERKQGPQKPSHIRRDASGQFASPDSLVVDTFPPEQQGRWTPLRVNAALKRRADELERRKSQHKPLPLDVDPDAAVKAYREASYAAADEQPLRDWDSLHVSDKNVWRLCWQCVQGGPMTHPRIKAIAPTIPPPAPISQAVDTLAVVEYREDCCPICADPRRYTLAELVTVGVFGSALAVLGFACLRAKGVL